MACRAGARERGPGRGRAVSGGPGGGHRRGGERLTRLRAGDLAAVLLATEPVRATRRLGVGGRPGIVNRRGLEADALIGLGRLDDAETALGQFEGAIPAVGLASAALTLARCRGNLAMARGQAIQAEAAFTQARLIEAQVPMPFERALLSLDDGRRLRGRGPAASCTCRYGPWSTTSATATSSSTSPPAER